MAFSFRIHLIYLRMLSMIDINGLTVIDLHVEYASACLRAKQLAISLKSWTGVRRWGPRWIVVGPAKLLQRELARMPYEQMKQLDALIERKREAINDAERSFMKSIDVKDEHAYVDQFFSADWLYYYRNRENIKALRSEFWHQAVEDGDRVAAEWGLSGSGWPEKPEGVDDEEYRGWADAVQTLAEIQAQKDMVEIAEIERDIANDHESFR